MKSVDTLSKAELIAEAETNRKRMAELEEKLAATTGTASSHLQEILDVLPVGVLLVDVDEYQILEANHYAARLTGLSRRELIGKKYRTFLCSRDTGFCSCSQENLGKERYQEMTLLNAAGEEISVFKTTTPFLYQGRKVFLESFVDAKGVNQTSVEAMDLIRALKRSESYFQAVLESADEFIWAVDLERCLLYWNPTFATHMKRFFSATLEKGQIVKELIPPRIGDFWEQVYQKGISGQTFTFEYKTVDGRDQLVTVNPLRQEGVIIGCSFFGMDVSKCKRIEEKLRESEELFRALFDKEHAAILVIEPGSGQIEEANQTASQFYGFSVDELTRMTIMDVNVLGEYEIEAEIKSVLEQNQKQFFFCHEPVDGGLRDLEASLGSITVGKRKLIYLIINDVTERELSKANLQQLKRIVSSTPDMISLVDQNYVLQMVNDSFVKAYVKSRKTLVGKRIEEVVGKEFFEQTVLSKIDQAFDGNAVEFESWMVFPAFGRRFMSLACNPVHGSEKEILGVAIDARDISSLKQAEDDLQRVFDSSLDMLCVVGFNGWFKKLNPAWKKILGWSEEEMKSHLWQHFVHEEDQQATIDVGKQLAKGESVTGFVNRFSCKDGSLRWISWNSYPDVSRREVFAVARDVTENKRMEAELRRLATTDALTGVANRRHFLDHAEQEVKRSLRYNTFPVLLSLDIDYFKTINDTYGHDVGDQALIAFVNCCKASLRSSDFFGRIGGEEFLALLTNSDRDSGWKTAERLRLAVHDMRVPYEKQTINFTVSIGMTLFQGPGDTLARMMVRADHALYEAKAAGRNQVVQELST